MIQHLPVESIPLLRAHPASRMPSAHFLRAQLLALRGDAASVYARGVDTTRTFYILDPENNLNQTYSKFSWFQG